MKLVKNELTSLEWRIYAYLKRHAYSEAHSAPAKLLVEVFGLTSKRELRKYIHNLRMSPQITKIIGSGNDGYFIQSKSDDANRRLRSQANNMIKMVIANGGQGEIERFYKVLNELKQVTEKPAQSQSVLKFNGYEKDVNYISDELNS
jgi:hypothetical protein